MVFDPETCAAINCRRLRANTPALNGPPSTPRKPRGASGAACGGALGGANGGAFSGLQLTFCSSPPGLPAFPDRVVMRRGSIARFGRAYSHRQRRAPEPESGKRQ